LNQTPQYFRFALIKNLGGKTKIMVSTNLSKSKGGPSKERI